MTQVWEHSPYQGAGLLLHLALADHANDEGVCWPSVPRLAAKARISERHVQRLLVEMERDGALIRQHRPAEQGHWRSNLYTLADLPLEPGVGVLAEVVSPGHQEVVAPGHQGGDTSVTRGGDPQVTLNRKKEPSTELPETPVLDDHFGPRTRIPGNGPVPTNRQAVALRADLDGWPPDVAAVVAQVCVRFNLQPPTTKKDKALWIERSRALRDACGEFPVGDVLGAVWTHVVQDGLTVEGPGSLVKMARAKAGTMRAPAQDPRDGLGIKEWAR